jgi:hypothetical protein
MAPALAQGLRILRSGQVKPRTILDLEPALIECGIQGLRLAALLHTHAGSLARAGALADLLESQGEEAGWPLFQLGLAHLQGGTPADAEGFFCRGEGPLEDALEVRCRILRMTCLGRMGSWAKVLRLAEETATLFPMLRQVNVLGALACRSLGRPEQEAQFSAASRNLEQLVGPT